MEPREQEQVEDERPKYQARVKELERQGLSRDEAVAQVVDEMVEATA